MALFQKSVLNKYLRLQEQETIQKAYKKYTKYFHNTTIQENIKNSKEEEYQGIFLTELFVNILGYVLSPKPNYNLVTEYKNQNNARKADGAILKNEIALGVIELKGTNTKDLESIRKQAFDYKANQKGCVYIVTSNFEKLRFYINDATEFEEFNLFDLTEDRFALLYLCLQKENVFANLPLKVKEDSLTEEDKITKTFYKDYSLFKRELFRDLVKRNAKTLKNVRQQQITSTGDVNDEQTQKELSQLEKNVKLSLFKKSQKLIDRFLFVFFSEDRGLLPPNSTVKILENWNTLKELDAIVPLYDRFKLYFKYLDSGRKGTDSKAEIYAYNGGLFKPDSILDAIEIDDELLYKHTNILANYDFESQVDVNILGHIFENSLNEIESVNAEIEGGDFDKQKSKRKKDGVFYTPKYITKYIVENTIGKLCEEKKQALNFKEEEYYKSRKGRKQATLEKLIQILDDYREWLLQLTICDPACGSGAFLNQALDFLIKEHTYIDELKTKLLGGGFQFPDIENTVLENNIFGVDLNEESVEIAKLSLWLRTAQPRRKLNDLSSNIKCGNSLIDSKAVAGDKAFNWQEQFPKVFEEKNKKAWHITTAIHDSRTSKRMVEHKVREKRFMGTKPNAQIVPLTIEEETIIVEEVVNIAQQDDLKIMAFNVCEDHMHIVLVSDENEIPKIIQKIKAKTARKINIHRGVTVISTREHAPLPLEKEKNTTAPLPLEKEKNIIAPLPLEKEKDITAPLPVEKERGEKQNSLWTQKYGCKEITSDEQLQNTIAYVKGNREKHELVVLPILKQKEVIQTLYQNKNKAFNKEYTGGFDVIIGNPPYVRQELFKEIKPYLEKYYKCYNSVADLYTYFIEKGINLMNENGLFSFILPNKFLKATYGKNIRKVMKEDANLELLLDFDDYPVFPDATTYPIIYVLNKKPDYKVKTFLYSEINKRDNTNDPINTLELKKYEVSFKSLTFESWNFVSTNNQFVLKKIKENSITLSSFVEGKINRGVLTGKNDVFLFNEEKKDELLNKGANKEIIKQILLGSSIKRYNISYENDYLLFARRGIDINDYPVIKDYLLPHYEELRPRNNGEIKGRKAGSYKWFEIQDNIAYYKDFESIKIVYPRTNNNCNFHLDNKGYYLSDNNFYIKSASKTLLGILNSKLIFFYLKNICTTLQGGYYDFRRDKIDTVPIKIECDNIFLEEKVTLIIDFNLKLTDIQDKFKKYIQSQYKLLKLSKKIQNWHELEFGDFIKELNKAIKIVNKERLKDEGALSGAEMPLLTKKDEFEWLDLFDENKRKAQELQTQINQTDKQIDAMVYELYGLTDDEIKIVENS